MPELPEVEVTRRHLDAVLTGARVERVEVSHPRTVRFNTGAGEVEARLAGRTVSGVNRTGKFIHAPLDDDQVLVAHLGMSGRFVINGASDRHTHFTAHLAGGHTIGFSDPRTFGFIAVFSSDEFRESAVANLGPDAWTATPSVAELTARLARRTASIKALLLDQRIMSGLGNIYADETLHLARIHPLRPGGSLRLEEVEELLAATRQVLARAIQNGGTSLDDLAYLLPDGRAGENLDQLAVYGRTDLPCPTCGTPVQRVVIRARSSHFCPSCQEPDSD